ncbi:hypothetical protein IMCC3317_21060 [Kordia antarctica]|uniref:Uncharacterized protein n=1 Tax=Kordia antarctica TaxID=1218801 RepID=A0A7L4ZKJ0_9FLAO|nr:hypothetical protein [Kordia antarctica]QHI36736.1 hypothetical protein IMCC3317_21060 [Kordia antarctica]
MSEENNNKQTLFRFVSFRNPNLAETKSTNLKFIHRDESLKGVFDQVTATNTQTKFHVLLVEASSFQTTSIKTVDELEKGVFSGLLKVGKSISNQTTLSAIELTLCKDDYIKHKGSDAVKAIWDNFIYQYLTQKDFYVKETLAYILKALHIGYVQTLKTNDELKRLNGSDFVKTALNATIIIPSSILGKAITSSSKKVVSKELSSRDSSLLTIALESYEKEQNAVEENKSLTQLKSEIQRIKNNYWANYENGLKVARSSYEKEHGENLRAYENQLSIIDELEESKAPEEEIKKAYELLATYEVPDFKFSYKEELNWDDIYGGLSEASLEYFLENFANAAQSIEKEVDLSKSEVKVADNNRLTIDANSFTFRHTTYDAVLSDINTQADVANTEVVNQANLPQDQYVNVGGVVVPISDSTTYTPHLSYILSAKKSGLFSSRGYVMLQVHVENSSWAVSNAIVSATTSTGVHTENISHIAVLNNKLNFPTFLRNNVQGISSLNIQVFFTNGREATLQLSTVAINVKYTGRLSLKPIGIEPIGGNPSEPIPTTGEHFGLKRLGVAEYMKVTQSVHAYVPGEVSNIENVMASELRHKSINELTRTEDTLTTTKSQEVEKISDTTKVNRAEMQTEVAKELDKQKSFQAHANFSYDTKVYKFDTGAAYASTNAQHISNRQAVTKSQEVTERAMERVQSKISEERISKIIQEVSLTNVHEYDNRGGLGETAERPKHITGVYRWVDKKMKNQIYNYGKRAMFEFMIPEPAKLHRLAIATAPNTLVAPVDPRKAPAPHKMSNATTATTSLLEYWAGIYGVQLTPKIPNSKQIIHNATGRPNTDNDFTEISSFQIPDNYIGKNASFRCRSSRNRGGGWQGSRYSRMTFPNLKGGTFEGSWRANVNFDESVSSLNVSGDTQFDVNGHNVDNYNVKVTINCEPSQEYINAWKLENFNAIIEAYQTALDAHNEEVANIEAEQAAKAADQKDVLGNFYRITESTIIKHNCIAYLLQNYLTELGQDFTDGDKMLNFRVNLGEDLDKYTAKAKFLEQAFEWTIMDYTFYPYFWADRKQWQEMYLSENTDTLFRSFLQAGMARVIVTVKPGFEEAVQYFLETGKVWLGGETPIIGDPLYMSITQEIQEPTGVPQGNYWITRIPTTLTILQAKSAGLWVTQALPIFPEAEPENCENPEQLETETSFTLDDVQMSSDDRSSTLPSNIVTP